MILEFINFIYRVLEGLTGGAKTATTQIHTLTLVAKQS
jgi:hypothetical protein